MQIDEAPVRQAAGLIRDDLRIKQLFFSLMIDISGDRPAGPVDRSISTGPGTPSIQFFLARAQTAQLVNFFISGDAVAKRGARTGPRAGPGGGQAGRPPWPPNSVGPTPDNQTLAPRLDDNMKIFTKRQMHV